MSRSAYARLAGRAHREVRAIRIFISSTWQDLQSERLVLERALGRLPVAVFAGMEYFGSRSETTREVSLAEVDRADLYIGIFAHRYGSGITEAEYRRAAERGLPLLLYFKDDEVPVPPDHVEQRARQAGQLQSLKRDLQRRHTIPVFTSPDDLAKLVVADLYNQLAPASSLPFGPSPRPINTQETEEAYRPGRRPWWVVIQIDGFIDGSGERFVEARIPSWNPHKVIRFPLALVPDDLRDQVVQDGHLMAMVNIGAERAEDLYLHSFEAAPEPALEESLG